MDQISELIAGVALIATLVLVPALILKNLFTPERRPLREAVNKTAEIVSRIVVWSALVLTLFYGIATRLERSGIFWHAPFDTGARRCWLSGWASPTFWYRRCRSKATSSLEPLSGSDGE